jgi:tetratricopeptide (TPR) repeat protein
VAVTAVGLLLLFQVAASGQVSPCREAELTAMLRAQEHLARGDDKLADAVLAADAEACTPRRVALLSLRAWAEARALAAKGGAVELQGPVQRILEDLRALASDNAVALDVEYADTAVRAAIAAAQDERPEMELLLTHARDLSERLQLRGRSAEWPRTFNEAAGELWFEVDRYEEAIAAYERAARADASAAALVGWARALARAGRTEDACDVYRRVTDAAAGLRALATPDLVRCR